MAAHSWTQTDLDNLEAAIAQGALRVKFSDREVMYQSRESMVATANSIRKYLGIVTDKPKRTYAKFSKGLK